MAATSTDNYDSSPGHSPSPRRLRWQRPRPLATLPHRLVIRTAHESLQMTNIWPVRRL